MEGDEMRRLVDTTRWRPEARLSPLGVVLVVAALGGCGAAPIETAPPPDQLKVVIDWRMQPHFPGMDAIDAPPAAPTTCPAPPAGRYVDGPFACTDGAGN